MKYFGKIIIDIFSGKIFQNISCAIWSPTIFNLQNIDNYFSEIMKYYGINENYFLKLCDKFKSPHLWKKIGKKWHLRHTANKDGIDD